MHVRFGGQSQENLRRKVRKAFHPRLNVSRYLLKTPHGKTSSQTPPSPFSTVSQTRTSCSTSTATPTASVPTKPTTNNSARKEETTSIQTRPRVRNYCWLVWGISVSAVNEGRPWSPRQRRRRVAPAVAGIRRTPPPPRDRDDATSTSVFDAGTATKKPVR